jgi:hypothetical protein
MKIVFAADGNACTKNALAFLVSHENPAGADDELFVLNSVFDCQAALPLLRQRLVQRQLGGADASEADVAVLDRLPAVQEPLGAAERAAAIVVDAAPPVPPATLARATVL